MSWWDLYTKLGCPPEQGEIAWTQKEGRVTVPRHSLSDLQEEGLWGAKLLAAETQVWGNKDLSLLLAPDWGTRGQRKPRGQLLTLGKCSGSEKRDTEAWGLERARCPNTTRPWALLCFQDVAGTGQGVGYLSSPTAPIYLHHEVPIVQRQAEQESRV